MLKPLTKTDYRAIAVDALRNTDKVQGTGIMRESGRYCALGVMAEAFGFKITADGMNVDGHLDDGYGPIVDKIGLHAESIVALNDAGYTFAQIAIWIENQP